MIEYQTANPEAEAQAKFSNLMGLVAADLWLSNFITIQNLRFYHQGISTSPDDAEKLRNAQYLVRLGIFWSWQDLVDMNSPLAPQALEIMTESTAIQNGKVNNELIEFLGEQTKKDPRFSNQSWQHGFPRETDG